MQVAARFCRHEPLERCEHGRTAVAHEDSVTVGFLPHVHVTAAQRPENPVLFNRRERAAEAFDEALHGPRRRALRLVAANMINELAVDPRGVAAGGAADLSGQVVEKQLKFVPQHQQLGQSPLDLDETLLGDADNRMATRGFAILVREQQPDVAQREPEPLRPMDEGERAHGAPRIEPIARSAARRRREQSFALVEAQHRRAHARTLRELPDRERRALRGGLLAAFRYHGSLDLELYFKLYLAATDRQGCVVLGIDKRLIVKSTSRWLAIGIAVGVLGLLASLTLYWFIGRAIDAMTMGYSLLAIWLPWIIALLAIKFLAGWLYRTAQHKASSLTKLTIRDMIYAHALRLGPAVLDRKRTGELVNIAVEGLDWIEMLYGIYFVQFVVGMATPLLLCLFIGLIDWVVGVALLVSVPLTPLFLGMMGRSFRKASERFAKVNAEQSARFLDSIQGMTTLKMFNLGKLRGAEMHAASEEQRRETMRLLLVNQMMILFVDFGFALGTTLVLTVTALLRLDAGALTPGAVVALILASAEFAKPLTLVGQFFFAGAVGRAYAKRIVAFLGESPGVEDQAGVAAPALAARPSLSLKDIVFQYASAARPAVDHCSLELTPGETVALVGASGSGKTTVTNLILRTLNPASGAINLGAHRADEVPADWVRAHLALVPQDPYLFHGTIADNLRVAKVDATDEELIAACRAANIHEQIAALPAGYATLVGERGLSLSGGQVQRLAIARALLKDAPIVLLDEPTSQIDLETEAVIQEALGHLTRDKSVLLIAHRLSTVRNADRIIVLGHGKVLESGTHAELLARGGAYAGMVAIAGAAA